MKIFSNKNRKRTLSLLLGSVMCASAAAGVASLVGTDVAAAEDYAKPTTTKLETLINSRADFAIGTQQTSTLYGLGATNDIAPDNSTTPNTATSNSYNNKIFLGIYDEVGHNKNNPLKYSGNIGIWADTDTMESDTNKTYANYAAEVVYDMADSDGFGIVSFRTKWDDFNALHLDAKGISNGYVDAYYGSGGYVWLVKSSTLMYRRKGTLKHTFDLLEGIEKDDELLVTYGVYQSGENENTVYLKIEKITAAGNVTVVEKSIVDSDASTAPTYTSYSVGMGGEYTTTTEGDVTVVNEHPRLLVAGVDEPLMSATLTENKKAAVGTSLADVTLTDSRYALVDTTGTIAEGTNGYDVKIKDYYGTQTGKVGTVNITSRGDFSAYSQKIEKLETLVDDREDIKVGPAANGLVSGSATQYWNTEEFTTIGNRTVGIYDEVEKSNGILDVDGNVSVTADYTANEKANMGGAMLLNSQTAYAATNGDGYGIISFRTKYDAHSGAYLSLGMMVNASVYIMAEQYTNSYYGYWFKVADGAVTAWKYYLEPKGAPADITTDGYEAFEVTPEDGDNLIVSYGVLKTSDTVNTLYLKIEKVNADNSVTLCYEGIHVDSDSSTLRLYDTERLFAFSYGENSADLTANPVLLVGGIDRPLLADKYNLTETDYEANEDEALPTLTEAGYTWVDTTAVYGKSEYAASYSLDYYGKTASVPVTVAVNVIGQRVTLKLMNGTTELYSELVKVGNTVDLSTLALDNVDTIIGWKLAGSEDLLAANTSFTATADKIDSEVVYNVVDIDMKQYDGASIRTTVDDNGVGGIRFVAMFNTADWTANVEAGYITGAYGAIVPAEATYYTAENGLSAAELALIKQGASFVGATAHTGDLGLDGAEGYSLYTVAMTDVKYQNYNRSFVSMTYITVTYADGSTADFATNAVTRSVYEVALAAKSAQAAADNTLYSSAQMEVINGYLAKVIEVNNTDGTFTVVDNSGHGLARDYELVSGNVAENVVTLTLTVQEGSLLKSASAAPVWYSLGDGAAVRYKANVTVDGTTATVTFTVA